MFLYPCFVAFGYLLFLLGAAEMAGNDPIGVVLWLVGLVFLGCAGAVWIYGLVNSYNIAQRSAVAT